MADDASALSRSDISLAGQPVIALWPKGAPSPLPDVGPEVMFHQPSAPGPMTAWLRNVTEPTLTVFPADPAKANGAGVIVAPGGGWRVLAWEHEGIDMARWFAERGVTAFLLKYRVTGSPDDPAAFMKGAEAGGAMVAQLYQRPMLQQPTQMDQVILDPVLHEGRKVAAIDGRRALDLARLHAADYGVKPDRIGMIGFSAGAFLTTDVAFEPGGAPLAFAAPIYGGETQGRAVPADGPALFACIAHDDRLLFRMAMGVFEAWSNADRPAELHVHRRGAHGFGMVPQGAPVDRWPELLEAWLADLGYL